MSGHESEEHVQSATGPEAQEDVGSDDTDLNPPLCSDEQVHSLTDVKPDESAKATQPFSAHVLDISQNSCPHPGLESGSVSAAVVADLRRDIVKSESSTKKAKLDEKEKTDDAKQETQSDEDTDSNNDNDGPNFMFVGLIAGGVFFGLVAFMGICAAALPKGKPRRETGKIKYGASSKGPGPKQRKVMV